MAKKTASKKAGIAGGAPETGDLLVAGGGYVGLCVALAVKTAAPHLVGDGRRHCPGQRRVVRHARLGDRRCGDAHAASASAHGTSWRPMPSRSTK